SLVVASSLPPSHSTLTTFWECKNLQKSTKLSTHIKIWLENSTCQLLDCQTEFISILCLLLFSHPDKNKDGNAQDRFIEINRAYDVNNAFGFFSVPLTKRLHFRSYSIQNEDDTS